MTIIHLKIETFLIKRTSKRSEREREKRKKGKKWKIENFRRK